MEVSITRFRKDLFSLINLALEGVEIYVIHKGCRLRLMPETVPTDRLSRLTPLQVINPKAPDLEDESWKQEMIKDWEEDWATL